MDYQNAEFYKLNKNNPDLVYNFVDERITYRKESDENGNLQIVEYRKKDGRKGTTRRVVSSYELTVDEFDIWKKKLEDEALDYLNSSANIGSYMLCFLVFSGTSTVNYNFCNIHYWP